MGLLHLSNIHLSSNMVATSSLHMAAALLQCNNHSNLHHQVRTTSQTPDQLILTLVQTTTDLHLLRKTRKASVTALLKDTAFNTQRVLVEEKLCLLG